MMLSLVAAMALSSGVAYAQNCGARVAMPDVVRAEGMTEVVGDIELRCVPGDQVETPGFGEVSAPVPEMMSLAIQLNAGITNEVDDDGNVEADTMRDDDRAAADGAGVPGYDDGEISLHGAVLNGTARGTPIDDAMFGDGELSDNGTMITWEIDTNGPAGATGAAADPFDLLADSPEGFSLIIRGVRANATTVGDGEDITVNVMVEGTAVSTTPMKVADVTTGLDVKDDVTEAVSGLQCQANPTGNVVTIRFVEGFADAFTDDHALVLHLSGVPDGVTVTPSAAGTGTAMNMDTGADLAPVTLESGTNSDGEVDLTSAGSAAVVYTFDDEDDTTNNDDDAENGFELEGTDPDLADEWNDVTMMFEWEAGSENTVLGSATVSVSYNPVGGDKTPRYSQGEMMDALSIQDCTTSMVFPFVTNQLGFQTGIALTNSSGGTGMCMLEYSGAMAPADAQMVMVGAGTTETFVVSTMAPGFQGYVEATCDFLGGQGFAFIDNSIRGMGTPTAAMGYIAVPAERK
jgi:hypothetical protein